jgi:hypothetical protein
MSWLEHATAYATMKWPLPAAHTRAGIADALATITPALLTQGRDRPPAVVLRTALYGHAFNPAQAGDDSGRPVTVALAGTVALADRCAWQGALTSVTGGSDGHCELVECCAGPMAGRDVGGEFIVAAAQILNERVPSGEDPRGPVALQAAHRPEPCFQPSVIGFDRVVRVALDGMQRRGDELIQDSRIGRGAVGGDLGRDRARAQRPGEEPPGGRQVTPDGEQHVDDLAVLVDGPVQVRPPPGNLDVGLVGEPPITRCMPAEPRRLDELGSEPLHPAVNG